MMSSAEVAKRGAMCSSTGPGHDVAGSPTCNERTKNTCSPRPTAAGAVDLHRHHGEVLRPPYIGLVVANRVWFGGGWTSTDWRRGPTDDDARHRVTQDSGGAIVFSRLGHSTGPNARSTIDEVRDRRGGGKPPKHALLAPKRANCARRRTTITTCPVWLDRRPTR